MQGINVFFFLEKIPGARFPAVRPRTARRSDAPQLQRRRLLAASHTGRRGTPSAVPPLPGCVSASLLRLPLSSSRVAGLEFRGLLPPRRRPLPPPSVSSSCSCCFSCFCSCFCYNFFPSHSSNTHFSPKSSNHSSCSYLAFSCTSASTSSLFFSCFYPSFCLYPSTHLYPLTSSNLSINLFFTSPT